MKILDRYIGRTVALGTLVVMLVLLALYTFVAFIGEMERVGIGNYGAAEAMKYVLYTLPKRVYELFPVTALLGTMVGLGGLAASSEVTAIRAAGVSIGRIGLSVMRVGSVLMAAVVLVGELIAPELEQYATRERAIALGQQVAMQGRSGFWARDGDSFINIQRIHPGGRLEDITLYQLDANHQLKTQTQAAQATYYDGAWQLAEIVRSHISAEGIATEHIPTARWESLLNPALLEVVMVRPDALSAVGLYQYVRYLHDNHLDATRYEQALWVKVVDPVTTGVMVLLALPFVLGPLRSVSLSQRVVAGSLVGITFHIVNRAFHYMGQIYFFDPVFSATFPTALFLMVTVVWLRRVR
jgi:lipopolysaccharide export system permease protein